MKIVKPGMPRLVESELNPVKRLISVSIDPPKDPKVLVAGGVEYF